jgi:hypothetical protein
LGSWVGLICSSSLKLCDPEPELVGVDDVLVALVAHREPVEEDPPERVGDARLAGERVGDHLARPPQQMPIAGLMGGELKAPVGSPAVALKHPGEVLAQDHLGVLVPAAGGDQVNGHPLAGERPQPRFAPVYPPAGLIRRHDRTLSIGAR